MRRAFGPAFFFNRTPAGQLRLGKPVSRFGGDVAFFRPHPGYPFRACETMNRVNALVAITVMAVMVSIFLDLITAGKHEDTLEEDGI